MTAAEIAQRAADRRRSFWGSRPIAKPIRIEPRR
jgi:hypothetical protein